MFKPLSELPLEKKLTQHQFSSSVDKIHPNNIEELKKMTKDIHRLYLITQANLAEAIKNLEI